MTISDVATLLRCKPKTIRNKMSCGIYQEGEDFIRRPHSHPLFIRSKIDPLAQATQVIAGTAEAIPMARSHRLLQANRNKVQV